MTADAVAFEKLLPLTPVVYYILLALADGDRHGYGIITDVAERTNGDVTIRTGTLYTAVRRLLEGGFVEETESRPDPEFDDERRRYYRLTDRGQRLLQAEMRRLRQMLDVAAGKPALAEPVDR